MRYPPSLINTSILYQVQTKRRLLHWSNRLKAYTLKIRGGVSVDSYGKKAGKGALIQEELSGTLGVSQDQYLFQPIGVDSYNLTVTGEVGRCLSTSSGGLNEHIPIVISIENHPNDSRVQFSKDGKVQALTSRMGTGGGAMCR